MEYLCCCSSSALMASTPAGRGFAFSTWEGGGSFLCAPRHGGWQRVSLEHTSMIVGQGVGED